MAKATPSRTAWVMSGSRGVHAHANEGSAGIRIVVGRTLAHQIRKEEHMIFSKLRDLLLLCLHNRFVPMISSIHHLLQEAAAEHTAHQMIFAIRVGKGMKGIVARPHRTFRWTQRSFREVPREILHWPSPTVPVPTAAAALSPAPAATLDAFRTVPDEPPPPASACPTHS